MIISPRLTAEKNHRFKDGGACFGDGVPSELISPCRCGTAADFAGNRRKCSTLGPMPPFQPKPGMLLMCDFDTGFKPPEMVKVRPVVVISPGRKRSRARLCTVVPLSSAAPKPVESFHCRINPQSLPRTLRRRRDSWAKCDMLYTVSVDRLDRVRVNRGGKPTYGTPRVSDGIGRHP